MDSVWHSDARRRKPNNRSCETTCGSTWIISRARHSEIDAFLSQGDSRPDPSLDRRELAAFASVASMLLNLDEMVTKQ